MPRKKKEEPATSDVSEVPYDKVKMSQEDIDAVEDRDHPDQIPDYHKDNPTLEPTDVDQDEPGEGDTLPNAENV